MEIVMKANGGEVVVRSQKDAAIVSNGFKVAKLFWPKVEVKGEEECWIWLGYPDRQKYGHLMLDGEEGNRLPCRAPRIAFWLANGYLPKTVEHSVCLINSCCNPNHMTAGGAITNNRANDKSKLKGGMLGAREARRLYATGQYYAPQLAAAFGISPSAMRSLLNGETWREKDDSTSG